MYMQWLHSDFMEYLDDWEREVNSLPGLKKGEKLKRCLSRETLLGLRITGLSKENHVAVDDIT